MPEIQEDYGEKFEYDPLWKGPMGIRRTKTDLPFLISFGIFLIFWMSIAIYAYSAGDIGNIRRNVRDDSGQMNEQEIYTNNHNNNFDMRSFDAAKYIAAVFIIFGGLASLVYIILLRWYAKFFVYTAVITICVLLFAAICFSFYLYNKHPDRTEIVGQIIGFLIIFVGVLVFFFLGRKKIDIACEVIKESSNAVLFFPSSLLFPIIPIFLYFITTVFAGSVLVYLLGIRTPQDEVQGHVYFFHCVNLFGYLWTGSFIMGFSQMTLSGTFATWYWTEHKRYIPNNTLIFFMHAVSKYHLGTVAFGSLILAVLQFINVMLRKLRSRLQGSANLFACLCYGWYTFLFANLERFIRFMNRNAYVMSAIHGTSFIQSAKDAFNLFMRNIFKVFVINKVTDGVLFLGQLVVVVLSLSLTYGWCYLLNLDSNTTIAAIILVVIGSILITISIFVVLRTAVDTIFLCVVEDFERNDGSESKPYFMSFRIKELLLREQVEV